MKVKVILDFWNENGDYIVMITRSDNIYTNVFSGKYDHAMIIGKAYEQVGYKMIFE